MGAQHPGYPRTQDWCQVDLSGETTSWGTDGYSICMINYSQNRSAGAQLGNFYTAQRVLNMDAFYVLFKP